MSSPDTNVMRATYATAATYRQSPDTARAAAFDAWLAKVKAAAWDEGVTEAYKRGVPRDDMHANNPYRQEATR